MSDLYINITTNKFFRINFKLLQSNGPSGLQFSLQPNMHLSHSHPIHNSQNMTNITPLKKWFENPIALKLNRIFILYKVIKSNRSKYPNQ